MNGRTLKRGQHWRTRSAVLGGEPSLFARHRRRGKAAWLACAIAHGRPQCSVERAGALQAARGLQVSYEVEASLHKRKPHRHRHAHRHEPPGRTRASTQNMWPKNAYRASLLPNNVRFLDR
eukprot:365296-Chlamydomonas_euryale.AAC.35